ncbi:hypothetical protein Bca52824_035425 [Brassica carinata]|uniref:Uncharacterized protein n=1 Tax=Brassica carinata TaxID=52824 RepID=A0A8X7S476_BRACI|nr:hypothetical protein Bca52824_035425 [Brassica carinata]
MAIADDTAEGTFVWVDGVMMKLHNLKASEAVQMLAEYGVNSEDSKIQKESRTLSSVTCIVDELGHVPVDDMDDNVIGTAREKTDGASSKVVKKARVFKSYY